MSSVVSQPLEKVKVVTPGALQVGNNPTLGILITVTKGSIPEELWLFKSRSVTLYFFDP